MKIKLLTILVLLTIVCFSNISSKSHSSVKSQHENNISTSLKKDLNEGEAIVWYLFHSGWAIKTKTHFLIFDYWQGRDLKTSHPSLSNGYINPEEIRDQNVIVFVSHAHGDHYDSEIHEWGKFIKNIEYVFGWESSKNPNYHYFTKSREIKKIGGVEINVINHQVDGIPEVAYLVNVDGLLLYHSGDHGFYNAPHLNQYKSNIDYLSTKVDHIDLAFIMTVDGGCRKTKYTQRIIDGAFYTIQKLHPNVIFPMHGGGCEKYYQEFKQQATARDVKPIVYPAKKRGDSYYYNKTMQQNNR